MLLHHIQNHTMKPSEVTESLIKLASQDTRYAISNMLNLYSYGSRVYECSGPESDFDFICVYKSVDSKIEVKDGLVHVTAYSAEEFKKQIDLHEMSVLECVFLPDTADKIVSMDFPFALSLPTLRASVSELASHCFVKAKKKLTVEKDFAPYIGKKSLFHGLRVILFGTQIAKYGRIIDYSEANNYRSDIMTFPDDWESLRKKYKPEFNRLMTEFRKLAPK